MPGQAHLSEPNDPFRLFDQFARFDRSGTAWCFNTAHFGQSTGYSGRTFCPRVRVFTLFWCIVYCVPVSVAEVFTQNRLKTLLNVGGTFRRRYFGRVIFVPRRTCHGVPLPVVCLVTASFSVIQFIGVGCPAVEDLGPVSSPLFAPLLVEERPIFL